MLESQLKTLIKSLDLTNELLTSIINKNAVGGPDVNEPGKELPKPSVPVEPVQVTQQTPATDGPNPDGNGDSPVPPGPVGGPASPPVATTDSVALQERIMHVSQATSNPMLGMQFLAQFKVSSFDELIPEQVAQTDKQLVEIAAAARVAL